MTDQRPTFRSDINGLRALSVALVVLFHVGAKGCGGGFVGVDVFFVISGYLMTRIIGEGLARGSFSYGHFLASRAARIWPALAATLLACLAVGACLLPPPDLLQIGKQALAAASFTSNHYFLEHGGYHTDGIDNNWLVHTWSLSVEWQFYLLYPLVLMAAARLTPRIHGWRAPIAPAALLAIAVPSFAAHVALSSVRPEDAFFLLPTRAWELVVGGLAHAVSPGSPRRGRALSYGGVALIVLSALWLGYRHVDGAGLGWLSLLPVGGALLVLASGGAPNLLLDNRVARAVGLASYSVYLVHWPVIAAAVISDVMRTHPWPARLGAIGASWLLGWLVHRFVEVPFMRRRLGVTAAPRPAWRSAGGILAVAALGALDTIATHGLAFRVHSSSERASSSDVTPALESDFFPSACSNFQKPADELKVCPLRRDERRHVLVIGDSHAEHLYPWFEKESAVSVDFFTEAECPPVPRMERLQADFHCRDYAELAWARAASPRYDTLIVSGTWNLIGGVGPPYCHAEGDGPCEVVADQTARQRFARDELRAAIQGVLAAGKTVVFLDGTPEAPVSIPQRLARERFWYGQPRLVIDSASLQAYAWVDTLLDELAGTPGFHRVSFRPQLCDAHVCQVWDTERGAPIYIDESHFAAAWMRRHGDIFAPYVRLERAP